MILLQSYTISLKFIINNRPLAWTLSQILFLLIKKIMLATRAHFTKFNNIFDYMFFFQQHDNYKHDESQIWPKSIYQTTISPKIQKLLEN